MEEKNLHPLATTLWLPPASREGEVEKEVLISSPWEPVIGCTGVVGSCTRGGLDWTLEREGGQKLEQYSLPREVVNAPSCQFLKGI